MYTDVNKHFVQYLLMNGCVTYKKAKELIRKFADIANEYVRSVEDVIKEINEKISAHLFKILIYKCEIAGEDVCVFINTCADDISQLPGVFTPADHELFEAIINNIMLSDIKHTDTITCLNLTSEIKHQITKEQVQKRLDFFYETGYLVEKNGNVYLGARTLAEFASYFRQQFPESITICHLCRDLVYYGSICSKCGIKIHSHCISRYKQKLKQLCPNCKVAWDPVESDTNDENGEEDIAENVGIIDLPQDISQPGPSGLSRTRRSKRRT